MISSNGHQSTRIRSGLPIGDQELPGLYLDFISTKLEAGPTRQAYDNLPNAAKTSWDVLKTALE